MKIIFLFLLFIFSYSHLNAQDFEEKPIDDFKTLAQFENADAFECYLDVYIQECLANSYGGSLSVRCFVGSQLWDREVNIYYERLIEVLSDDDRLLLEKAQEAWIASRDETINFNSSMLDKKYEEPGTMFVMLRAKDASETITPIIKQHALLLRAWYTQKKADK